MSDYDDDGRRIPDDDERRDAFEARRARHAQRCQCSHIDMPGTCPGPAFCPLVGEREYS